MEGSRKPNLPIGIQDFPSIREYGYVYVDKTKYVEDIVSNGQYYFLSRPRRFGKSLLLSTIEQFFLGRRDLFKGLYIDSCPHDWQRHVVLRLDLSNPQMGLEALESYIDTQISLWEDKYGSNPAEKSLNTRFAGILSRAHAQSGHKVVILVDEYDAPLYRSLGTDGHEAIRDLLRSMYIVLKSGGANIRFAMLTGVTRFSRMSIFRGLNNLQDITLMPRYAAVCGFTLDEIEANVPQGIDTVAETNGWTREEAIEQLRAHYNGYHFCMPSPDIYNPFSIAQVLQSGYLNAYWYASGNPKVILDALDKTTMPLPQMLAPVVDQFELGATDSYETSVEALLFQAGYLTIKKYNANLKCYTLGVPNLEVQHALYKGLLTLYSKRNSIPVNSDLLALSELADSGEAEKMMLRLQSFFADIPYTLGGKRPEIYYENNLYLIFKIIGTRVQAEYCTSEGRIDLVVCCGDWTYVFEFKLDRPADEAMEQIKSRRYPLLFARDARNLVMIGASFSSASRNIDSWVIERGFA